MQASHKLQQLFNLLKQAVQSKSSQSQKRVYDKISRAQLNNQFYIGLATIGYNNQVQKQIRQMALLTLKSALKRNFENIQFTPQEMNCFKKFIMQAMEGNYLTQPNHQIVNNTMKSLVSVFALWNNRMDYQILQYIMQSISAENIRTVWVLDTLQIILEDIKSQQQNISSIHQAQFMQLIQKFMGIFVQIVNDIRTNIEITIRLLACMNHLLRFIANFTSHDSSNFIHKYFHDYVMAATNSQFIIALSAGRSLLGVILDAINQIISIDSSIVTKNKQNIHKILSIHKKIGKGSGLAQQNKQVKKWLSILLQIIQPQSNQERQPQYLPQLTDIVIKYLQFSKQDEINIKMEMQQENNPYQYQQQDEDCTDDGDNIRGYYGFTKRKLSVMIIEKLFIHYPEQEWTVVYPYIQHCLASSDFKQRECGVLLIGIIYQKIEDHLEFLQHALPLVMQNINNKQLPSLLRCTSLWMISKISHLIIRYDNLYENVQQQLLICVRNSNNQIRDAAYSSFDQLISASQKLPSKLNEIIEVIINGIRCCQGKPLYSVLKTCSHIYQRFGSNVPQPITQSIIVQLCTKWGSNSHIQSIMSPILELLTTISSQNKQVFKPFVVQVFQEAYKVLEQEHQKTIVLRAIDLLSSIASINQPKIINVLAQNQQFHKRLNSLLNSQENQIRNFSYGLVGDICKIVSFPKYAQAHFLSIFNNYNKNNLTSSSNALTCLTDLIVSHPFLSAKYSSMVMLLAIQNLNTQNIHEAYAFNFARIYGRLANVSPQDGSKLLKQNLKLVCQSLRTHESQSLTDQTYRGIFKMIEYDPQQVIKYFQYLVERFITYKCLDKQLQNKFQFLLKSYRNSLTKQQWKKFLNNPVFLPAVSKKIQVISS